MAEPDSVGRITERGSHDELMELGGTYAEFFELQAMAYRPGRGFRRV